MSENNVIAHIRDEKGVDHPVYGDEWVGFILQDMATKLANAEAELAALKKETQ